MRAFAGATTMAFALAASQLGCAMDGQSKAWEMDETPHAAMASASDAVIHISGLS